jgi:hypothetical protein
MVFTIVIIAFSFSFHRHTHHTRIVANSNAHACIFVFKYKLMLTQSPTATPTKVSKFTVLLEYKSSATRATNSGAYWMCALVFNVKDPLGSHSSSEVPHPPLDWTSH